VDGVPRAPLTPTGAKGKVRAARQGGLGTLELGAVELSHVQAFVTSVVEAGYSVNVARHCRSVLRTVFEYAEAAGYHQGVNPVKHVQLPEAVPKRIRRGALAPPAGEPARAPELSCARNGHDGGADGSGHK
jgi:hypothetical protein